MNYQEYKPSSVLSNFIQCYFICETEVDIPAEDKVFASGSLEIMFNVGETKKQFRINDKLVDEPNVQLWGQVLAPVAIKSVGKHAMFGIRFFPHTAACFLNESIEQFNDRIFDLEQVMGNSIRQLYLQLLEADTITRKIELTELFIIERLARFDKKLHNLHMTSSVMHELRQEQDRINMDVMASRYGISSRYLQKIFLQYSGLTPNLFRKITRFQKSLHLVSNNNTSLTSIAHHCGYFDQSHFIKDFKEFTGTAPSQFRPGSSTELLALLK